MVPVMEWSISGGGAAPAAGGEAGSAGGEADGSAPENSVSTAVYGAGHGMVGTVSSPHSDVILVYILGRRVFEIWLYQWF